MAAITNRRLLGSATSLKTGRSPAILSSASPSSASPAEGNINLEDIESYEKCMEEMDKDSHYQKLAYVLKVSQGPSVQDFITTIRDNKWTYRLTLTDNGDVDDVSTFKFEFKLIKSPCNQTGQAAEEGPEVAAEEDLIDDDGNFTGGISENGFTMNREAIWSQLKTITSNNPGLVTQLQDINSFNELDEVLHTSIVHIQSAQEPAAGKVPKKKKIDLSNVQLTIALLGALEAAYIEKQSVANENDIQIMVSCGISLISSIYVLYKKMDELEAGADKVIENFIGKSVFLIKILGDNTQKILEVIKASCDYNYGNKAIENANELARSLVVLTQSIMENNRGSAVGTGEAIVTTVTVSSNILSYIVWELIHLPVKMYRNPKKTGAVTVIGLLFVAQMYRHEIVEIGRDAVIRHMWYRLTGRLSGVAQTLFMRWFRGEQGFQDYQTCATQDQVQAVQDRLDQMMQQMTQQNTQQCFNDPGSQGLLRSFSNGLLNNVANAAGNTVGSLLSIAAQLRPRLRLTGGKKKRTKKRKRRRRGGSKKTKRRGKKSKKGGKRRRGGSKKRNRRSQRKTKK